MHIRHPHCRTRRAEYVAVSSTAAVSISAAVGHYPYIDSLQDYEQFLAGITDLLTIKPASYDGIAKVYEWDFETRTYEQADLAKLVWTKQTVMLTHGWNDWLCRYDNDRGRCAYEEEFMNAFARDFEMGRESDELDNYNILAVDWYADGQFLGSNPNGLPSGIDLAANLVGFVDANRSAQNGVNAAHSLAASLRAAGLAAEHLSHLMLIGHSNGAGFMASLAAALHEETDATPQQRVSELVSLDVPWATFSDQRGCRRSTVRRRDLELLHASTSAFRGFGLRAPSRFGLW